MFLQPVRTLVQAMARARGSQDPSLAHGLVARPGVAGAGSTAPAGMAGVVCVALLCFSYVLALGIAAGLSLYFYFWFMHCNVYRSSAADHRGALHRVGVGRRAALGANSVHANGAAASFTCRPLWASSPPRPASSAASCGSSRSPRASRARGGDASPPSVVFVVGNLLGVYFLAYDGDTNRLA